mmetsp:Transcript_70737/g.197818  ORF Transcript_70737/g.197818 Transcript_70737/m.197818 type:complete len:218 (+) Transcript_70737:1710-2363(+)
MVSTPATAAIDIEGSSPPTSSSSAASDPVGEGGEGVRGGPSWRCCFSSICCRRRLFRASRGESPLALVSWSAAVGTGPGWSSRGFEERSDVTAPSSFSNCDGGRGGCDVAAASDGIGGISTAASSARVVDDVGKGSVVPSSTSDGCVFIGIGASTEASVALVSSSIIGGESSAAALRADLSSCDTRHCASPSSAESRPVSLRSSVAEAATAWLDGPD